MNGVRMAMCLFLAFAGLAAGQDATAPATAKREIELLFYRLEQSHCQFNRNGSWYDAKKAADHLRGKYDYLLRKGGATTAESFIVQAASVSSVSGKPYLVRCGDQAAVESEAWFSAELLRVRRTHD